MYRYRLRNPLIAVFSVFAVAFLLAGQASAQGQAPDLKGSIIANDPSQSSLRLENTSARSCQVATTAQGTISITRVEQNGKLLQPVAHDGASDEDIGYLLKSQLKTLKPGESIEIPLQVYQLKSGLLLRATAWSSGAGVFSQQYSIEAGKPLTMELNYSLPITPAGGEPACGMVFATTVSGSKQILPVVVAASIGIVVVALVLLVLWLLRKRRGKIARTTVAGALLVMISAVGLSYLSMERAHADIVVPPSMQSQFDSCMATFEANRDITGPALDVIHDPANHVEIIMTSGGSDMTVSRNPDGSLTIRIYWNPNDRHPYAGTGGSADMCTPLYHEMYHALDAHNGTFSRDDCGGIERKEVAATRAQNILRERLGLPQRSHYGETPLPSGDCTPPPNPAQCTGIHCGSTNGDPHLRTFDGLYYDFQAAGEFVAARSESGNYEVQVRQEAWQTSRMVSLNTSMAFKIGADRLEVRAGTAMELLVNGRRQSLEAKALPGGGRLDIEQGIIILTWRDGSKAYVRSVGAHGLALSTEPSASLDGKLEGLLGDANGNSNNDLRARGSSKVIKPTHTELYPDFADSWRITDKASLFTYDPGKTTKTYTDRSFPDELSDPKNLPGYAAAEAYCRSMRITNPVILANCALDVAITGRPEFAGAAEHGQSFAAGADYGGTIWRLTVQTPGETPSVTFDAIAGEKIYVDVPQSSLPSQCGVLNLLRPDGQEITRGCIINGSGQIDGIVLPDSGKYTIKLDPSGDTVGSAALRLLRINDERAAITPDGKEVTATIRKPGEVSYHTFSGQAGQRVYVHIPSSTLRSDCGVARLLGPDGYEIAGGCIINGSGQIDTVMLPESGQYTIAINPREALTGVARLRLIVATAETKAIAMDGAAVTASLAKPGSIAQLTFDGAAGQRIYLDVPSSTLPSQCGVLDLKGPDSDVVTSGCIINRKGGLTDSGFVLPSTGRYTLVLDPSDDATGKTALRLRSR